MWYVYRGINHTTRQIYYGASPRPRQRVDGSHCVGGTKALRDWDCDNDDIEWDVLWEANTQTDASAKAHELERQRAPKGCAGYEIIQTGGI